MLAINILTQKMDAKRMNYRKIVKIWQYIISPHCLSYIITGHLHSLFGSYNLRFLVVPEFPAPPRNAFTFLLGSPREKKHCKNTNKNK